MCDRCEKLDAEIEQLKLRVQDAGPDMLPAIELLIAARLSRREMIQCREQGSAKLR
jgi:hypothetical protein